MDILFVKITYIVIIVSTEYRKNLVLYSIVALQIILFFICKNKCYPFKQ